MLRALILSLSLFMALPSHGENPILVKDFNQTTINKGSNPFGFFEFNNKLYFSANDPQYGYEIWQSDGTTTTRVTDINTVGNSTFTNPYGTNLGDRAIFSARDGTYKSFSLDPNNNLTSLSEDTGIFHTEFKGEIFYITYDKGWRLRKFSANGYVDLAEFGATRAPPVVLNNTLYFVARDANNDYRIHMSDGSLAGTNIMDDKVVTLDKLVLFNNKMYFAGTDAANGKELWSSDGTAQGTSLVLDMNATSLSSMKDSHIFVFNNELFFIANSNLYKLNNLNEAVFIQSGFPSLDLEEVAITPKFAYLFFQATTSVLMTDGNPNGLNTKVIGASNFFPHRFATQGDWVYFLSSDTPYQVFKANGDTAIPVSGVKGSELKSVAGRVYISGFAGDEDRDNRELWAIDTVNATPRQVFDINPTIGTKADKLDLIGKSASHALISRTITSDPNSITTELWASQGSPETTLEITNIPNNVASIKSIIDFDNKAVFALKSQDANVNDTLWISNGTTSGTNVLVNDTEFLSNQYLVLGNQLYFSASRLVNNVSQWYLHSVASNATGASNVISPATQYVYDLNVYNNEVYFLVQNDLSDGLWKTNAGGTASEVINFADPTPEYNLMSDGSKLFLREETDTQVVYYHINGKSLNSIATYAKTRRSDNESGGDMELVFGQAYLRHYDRDAEITSFRLMQTTGTTEAFTIVGRRVAFHQIDNKKLLFNLDDTSGELRELVDNQLVLVSDFNSSEAARPSSVIEYNGLLYFMANGGKYSRQIWYTDGNSWNTKRLTDMNANGTTRGIVGDTNTGARRMIAGANGIYVIADDGVTGKELYFFAPQPELGDQPTAEPRPTSGGALGYMLLILGGIFRLRQKII